MNLRAKRIILTVTNDLSTDQRMHRICNTLSETGAMVTLVGRKRKEMLLMDNTSFKTTRLSIPFRKGLLFYAFYNIQLFFFLLFRSVDIIVSCDLDTLPAGWLASAIRGKKLVFDAHEIFTEVPELIGRPFTRNFWLLLEKMLIRRITAAYTVNRSLAAYYNEKYGVNMEVIRNVPIHQSEADIAELPSNHQIPTGKKIILYQGSVNKGRGIELLIDALPFLPDVCLLIAGDGDILQNLKQMAVSASLTDRIVFLGRLSPPRLKPYTVKADLGISVEENLGLNYFYSSPNKVYDYIQAGVPVLVSPFPEMVELLKEFKVGESVKERTPEGMAVQITRMLYNIELRDEWQKGLRQAAGVLTWENEQAILVSFYQNL